MLTFEILINIIRSIFHALKQTHKHTQNLYSPFCIILCVCVWLIFTSYHLWWNQIYPSLETRKDVIFSHLPFYHLSFYQCQKWNSFNFFLLLLVFRGKNKWNLLLSFCPIVLRFHQILCKLSKWKKKKKKKPRIYFLLFIFFVLVSFNVLFPSIKAFT